MLALIGYPLLGTEISGKGGPESEIKALKVALAAAIVMVLLETPSGHFDRRFFLDAIEGGNYSA
jgi:hypothetical protein